MSVERVVRKDGSVVWRVRWRQAGRNRSKVLGRKRDAEAFDAEIVRRKRTGELAQLDAGNKTDGGQPQRLLVHRWVRPGRGCVGITRERKRRVSGALLVASHPLPSSCLCTASGLATRAALLPVVRGEDAPALR